MIVKTPFIYMRAPTKFKGHGPPISLVKSIAGPPVAGARIDRRRRVLSYLRTLTTKFLSNTERAVLQLVDLRAAQTRTVSGAIVARKN